MDIFKCNICGGTLEINEDEAVATCEYCGTKQSLPELKYVKSKKKRKSKVAELVIGITHKFLSNIKVLVKKCKSVDKKKKQKTFALITGTLCGLLVLFVVGIQITNNYIIPNSKYEKAIFLYDEKRYEEAEALFNEISQFKNANEYSDKCVTNIVKNSTVVDFLHKQDMQMSYREFVKLYGNMLKEEIRYRLAPVMPSTWKNSGGFIVSDVVEYSIGETDVISSVFFWNAEKIQNEKNYLLGKEAYIGGTFATKSGYTVYQHEVDYLKNKENAILSDLYFAQKKEVTKKHFEELVSYISTFEGEHTDIEYTSDKYTAKWISGKYEYELTYKAEEKELQYLKKFK